MILTKVQEDKLTSILSDGKSRVSIPRLFLELTQDFTKAFTLWDCWFKANHSHCKEPYTFYVELKEYVKDFYINESSLKRHLNSFEEQGWMKPRYVKTIYRKNKSPTKNTFIHFNRDLFYLALHELTVKMTAKSGVTGQNDRQVQELPVKMTASIYTDTSKTDTSVTDASFPKTEILPTPTVSQQLNQTANSQQDLINLEKKLQQNFIKANESRAPSINPLLVLPKLRNNPDIMDIYSKKNLHLRWDSFDEFFFHLAEKALNKHGTTMTVALFKSWIPNERAVEVSKISPEDIFTVAQKVSYREYRSTISVTGNKVLGIKSWYEAGEPES